jgi:chitinase
MTMDFAEPPAAGSSMLQSVRDALQATHAQLAKLYSRYGIRLRSVQLWQRLGATVMIGQNNIQGEIFTTADARGLVGFASANHLGRISMWALNRDSQCGSYFPETGVLSTRCSGTAQSFLQFSQIFGQFQGVSSITTSAGDVQPPAPDTDPADAPYPQWSATGAYPSGYKIVEDGEIYQSKWYNSGDDPQAQVQYPWQTPWELLGPVPPGDHAPVIAKLSRGTYPAWSISAEYKAGDKVLYQGLPYEAKWANQGISPQSEMSNPSGSPWQPLYKIPGEPAASPIAIPSEPAASPTAIPSEPAASPTAESTP